MSDTQNVSRSPNYWSIAATVDQCNAIIQRHEEQIAYHKKLVREWKKRRDAAIRLAEEEEARV